MVDKENFAKDINVPRKEPIMIDGVEVLKEKINMCFILLLNKLETPETIEQTIYEHLDAFVKEWNTQLARKMQECEEKDKEINELRQENEKLVEWQKTVARLFDRTCRCSSLDENTAICKENGKECISIVGCRDRYRKALEEIEKATKINCEEICGRKFEDCNDTSCFSAELLNIINKVKGDNR